MSPYRQWCEPSEFCLALFCCCCINQLIVSLEAFLEEQLAYQDAKYPREVSDLSGWQPDETQIPLWTYCCTPHCCEPAERPPPTTESEVRREFIRYVEESVCLQMLWPEFLLFLPRNSFFYFSSCKRFTDSRTRLEAWQNNLITKTSVSKHTHTHKETANMYISSSKIKAKTL